MWAKTCQLFHPYPAQLKVATIMLENGLRVGEKNKIYCGNVEMSAVKIARSAGVDRRIVVSTIASIMKDDQLRGIFTRLRPTLDLSEVAKHLGFAVTVIRGDPRADGIISEACAIIASEGIAIRQIIAEDPDIFPSPEARIITEKALPGEMVNRLLKIRGVHEVTVK